MLDAGETKYNHIEVLLAFYLLSLLVLEIVPIKMEYFLQRPDINPGKLHLYLYLI